MPVQSILKPERLDPNMYHPSVAEAVQALAAKGIHITVFPGLIKIDKLDDLEQWLLDNNEVRSVACDSCTKAGHVCILHNGVSYRCLHCLIADGRPCSHQLSEQSTCVVYDPYSRSLAEMEELGYEAKPPCMDYRVARSLGMTAVPEGFKWAGKKQQDRRLLDRLVKKSKKSKRSTAAEEPTEQASEAGEETDQLADDDEEGSKTDNKATIMSVLEEIHDTLKEVLVELKVRREFQARARDDLLDSLKRKREAKTGASEPEFVEGSSKRTCSRHCYRYSF